MTSVTTLYTNITLPELVIFGFEFTLVPFFLDLGPKFPFSKSSTGEITDCEGESYTYYPDVPKIFQFLKEKDIKIAITSCTFHPREVNQLINLFGWDKYVDFKAIAEPVFKKDQVKRIHDLADINFCHTLFYDDAYGNVRDVRTLNVHSVLVERGGIKMKAFMEGLKEYQEGKIRMYAKADNYPKIPVFMKDPYIEPEMYQKNKSVKAA